MAHSHSNLVCSFVFSTFLASRAQAISTFQPDCTLPPDGAHFVSYPNTRSSLSILFSMTTVIILCTFSILHLNVPAVHRTGGFWSKTWRKILDMRIKLKWMLLTMVVPEYLLGKAISDSFASKAFKNDGDWQTRTYLANMGYFVLQWEQDTTEWATVKQAVDDVLADEDMPSYQRINIERLRTRFWALNAWQWKTVAEWNIARLPSTPEYQLDKLDGGSILIKLLALAQVLYLVVQLIGRVAAQLPRTQLEVSAVAFAVCSFATYIWYLFHPQHVDSLSYIQVDNWIADEAGRSPQDLIKELGKVGPLCLLTRYRGKSSFDPEVGPEPIPNDSTHMGPVTDKRESRFKDLWVFKRIGPRWKEVQKVLFGIYIGGGMFGSIHLGSTNFTFPTSVEKATWDCCCFIQLALPVLCFFVYPLVHGFRRVSVVFWGIIFVAYPLSRLYLIVESYRALFFQPPEAFDNTWSSLLSHWRA